MIAPSRGLALGTVVLATGGRSSTRKGLVIPQMLWRKRIPTVHTGLGKGAIPIDTSAHNVRVGNTFRVLNGCKLPAAAL